MAETGYQFSLVDLISLWATARDMEKTEQSFKEIFDVYNKIVIPGILRKPSKWRYQSIGEVASGAIAAASLDADVYENWTDVS